MSPSSLKVMAAPIDTQSHPSNHRRPILLFPNISLSSSAASRSIHLLLVLTPSLLTCLPLCAPSLCLPLAARSFVSLLFWAMARSHNRHAIVRPKDRSFLSSSLPYKRTTDLSAHFASFTSFLFFTTPSSSLFTPHPSILLLLLLFPPSFHLHLFFLHFFYLFFSVI